MMKKQKFLEKYLNTQSPSGWEEGGQKVWLDYVKPFCDSYIVDAYGSVAAVINPKAEYKVVIEAHADEISWSVYTISDKGYLSVVRNGGSDHQVAPGQSVNILTDGGKVIEGVFGWVAIHERKGDNATKPEVKNLYVDVGAESKEEVEEMGIHIGAQVTYDTKYKLLNDKYHLSRALDNRIGGYCIAETLRRLRESGVSLKYGLYVVNAVQEEVGLRGAKMMAERIKPNVAIVTDVCHDAKSPLYTKSAGDVKCGDGPVLWYGVDNHRNVMKSLRNAALSDDIPFQVSTNNGNGGTDTTAFYQANGGTPSALLSFPLKYMHTSVEMVHKDDVENAINILYNFLRDLEPGTNFNYFN